MGATGERRAEQVRDQVGEPLDGETEELPAEEVAE